MPCGRVSSWKKRPTFEELAVIFEGSTASGTERAYRKAVEHLTNLLVEDGTLRVIRLKQKSQKKRKKKRWGGDGADVSELQHPPRDQSGGGVKNLMQRFQGTSMPVSREIG